MINFLGKIEKIKDEILNEKGSLRFFGLFSRNDKEGVWDLVISADWIESGKTREAVKYLIEKIDEKSIERENHISGIVAFSSDENFLNHLANAFKKNNVEKISETESKIKLFDDFVIKAVVLHSDFDDFEVKTLKRKDANEVSVF